MGVKQGPAPPVRERRRLGLILSLVGGLLVVLGGTISTLRMLRADSHSWELPPGGGLYLALVGVGGILLLAGLWIIARAVAHARATPHTFLRGEEEEQILSAIRGFERRTSGELRLHLSSAKGDVMEEARRAFEALGMTATRERNGVLFFVAVPQRQFAVLGDQGIDQKVPLDFWSQVVERVRARFLEGQFGAGLAEGIEMAGAALAAYFPVQPGDVNELPDHVSRD